MLTVCIYCNLTLNTFACKSICACRKYEGVQAAVKKLASPQDIGWLRVNVTPMKQALLTWSAKWSHMFTSHLQKTLVDKLAALDKFMIHISAGLDAEVKEGPGMYCCACPIYVHALLVVCRDTAVILR